MQVEEPDLPSNIAEEMDQTLPGSTQMVVITGKKIGSKSGTLYVFNKEGPRWVEKLKTKAYFGDRGLVDGEKRRSGNLQTPTGIWKMGAFAFGQHQSAPDGMSFPYRAITNNSWWSAEHNSTYNTWVESSKHVSGEHLVDARVQYEYAIDTGYNAHPNESVVGRGTAIFIHCFEPPDNALGEYTHGCIAISPDSMVELFRMLDADAQPSCAIGTLKRGAPTSIWAY